MPIIMSSFSVYAAEDDQEDQRSLQRTFKKAGQLSQLTLFDDGMPLLNQLEQSEPPDCILLDIGLPEVSGLEVLDFLRTSALSNIPVFVMVTSSIHHQLLSDKGCDPTAFLTKPVSYEAVDRAFTQHQQLAGELS